MKRYLIPVAVIFLSAFFTRNSAAQIISNKMFSLGTYGRVGAGFSPAIKGNIGRSLNLNGMGSVGGRMEEADYAELVAAFHYKTPGQK